MSNRTLLLNFNSNIVQLKVNKGAVSSSFYSKFQFQYSTIKRISWLLEQKHQENFNSNIVQLKEKITPVEEIVMIFQFQYSTIKRVSTTTITDGDGISIPI